MGEPKIYRSVMSDIRILASGLCLSALLISTAANAQAPLFSVPELSPKQLQERSLQLSQEAFRLVQVSRFEDAESLASLAVQLSQKNFQSYTILGIIYLQNNKVDLALKSLKKAVEIAPDNSRVYFNLALVYQRQKDYANVATTLEKGLKLDPKASDEYFNLGNAYIITNRRPAALKAFESAVAQKKDFWEAINNIGLLNYELGNIEEAESRWQQAVTISDKAAEPRLALGVALYAQGNQEKGLSLAEEAFRLDKRYSQLDYLKDNLWGDKLLAETAKLLATPRIKESLLRIPDQTIETDGAVSSTP
jgi:Flp pilus assembly protein TadD